MLLLDAPLARPIENQPMPPALLRLGQSLLIAAMFAACGGHWLLLQSLAWSSMIVDYSRSAGLTEAVEKTFDGQHPCDLCKVIQKTKASERQQEARVLVSKCELFYAESPVLVYLSRRGAELPVGNSSWSARVETPRVRPPRLG